MTGSGGIQTAVSGVPAPAVIGDFCDSNPRYRVVSGPGGLVAGPAGVTVGRFGWLSLQGIDPDNAATIVNSFGSGVPNGIVSRPDSPAIITAYLADATMLIQQGGPVPLWSGVGLWVKNDGSAQATYGQKAYADFATGKVSFAATASASTATFTGSIAAGTFSIALGTINGNVLTAPTGSTGIVVGGVLSGTNVATGTAIVFQLTGTAGGPGTYAVSIPEQTVAATTISGTFGTLTTSAVTGTIEVGGLVTGGGATTGTIITALGTGTGGAGTYIVNLTQTSSPTASTTNVESKWFAVSSGAAGELVKISDKTQ